MGATASNLAVDIRLLGDKELERQLKELTDRYQKQAVRAALRKSMTRVKKAVVPKIPTKTGVLREAYKATKHVSKTRKTGILVAWPMPVRALLGKPQSDPSYPWYYPYHVEYGHGSVPPDGTIRRTVNSMERAEFAEIGREIARQIIRLAKKYGKKVAA